MQVEEPVPNRRSGAARAVPPLELELEGGLLGRGARIGRIMAKHGLKDWFSGKGDDDVSIRARARRFRLALEELGPTFAKLGQILSTRPDLLPPAFIDELARLQDRVPPLPEEQVVSQMERELGVPWEDVFESIDPRPMAAGTIAEVHRATLETGERVVVKVQRPNAEQDILRDLGLLELFAQKTAERAAFRQIIDLPAITQHLSESLKRELDFRQEAANIDRMREVLEPFARLDVPGVHEMFTTPRLLVMEEIQGVPIREAPQGAERTEAARQLLEAYYRQILTEGFFHADPHPGNMLWWQDKIYFLDFGMIGEVDPHVRELLLMLLLAFWQEDVSFLTDTVLMLAGEDERADVDVEAFSQELGKVMARYRRASLKEIQLGPILQEITEIAIRHDVRLPASLALTGKALAQMQLAAAELDPTLDPFSVAGKYVVGYLSDRLRGGMNPQKVFYQVQKLRVRFARLTEALERLTGARPGPKLTVNFRGTERLEEIIRGAGRRLSLSIVSGGAIVGSALTAASPEVADWVPATLGAGGGVLGLALVVDLLRRR